MSPRDRSRPRATRSDAAGPRRVDPSRLPAWAALCFFASGAAALLYEVAWSKQLSYVLGNSLHAVATVVAAFLAGLAIGARLLGVPLAARGNGVRTYAWLEMGVGLLGLVWLPILRGIDPVVGALYRALGGEGSAFAVARFLLLFALLVPPAALMGATLPVLVARFEKAWVGPVLARLYAVNTFGAVAGSVAAGFVLMPGIGLMRTTWVAAALNAGVSALAWTMSARGEARASADASVPRAAAAQPPPGPRWITPIFALLFALSGLSALAFQIAWVRLFGLVFGSSVYSFSAVLGVYLLGLALGSAAAGLALGRGTSFAAFGRLQLGLALSTALMAHAFSRLPDWMWQMVQRAGDRWAPLFLSEVGATALLLLVPCALLGAVFPVATRLLQRHDGGDAAGLAYAVNTAGTIAGSLVAGFFAVPTWGVQGTHLAAVLLSLAIGLGALAMSRLRREGSPWDWAVALGAVAAVGVLAVGAPRWDPALMSAGVYRPIQASQIGRRAEAGQGSPMSQVTHFERVLYYREGINGSVMVGTDREGLNRWLRVGGKVDASTGDMETQVLLGLVPAAMADSGARSLVIGLGSGITASAALAAGAGPTDVVELEPGVVAASRFFHEPGASPLDDPRVSLIVGDARTHLAHSGRRYGMVVSEPSNPWIAGINNLFTVDFYRLVRDRLEPRGVFCQWLQLYELSPETLSSLMASFLEVFPSGQVYSVWRGIELLLVAAPDNARLSLRRLETPGATRLLGRANIRSAEQLPFYYGSPLSSYRAAARGAPLNRDDRPIVEYRAPRDLVAAGRAADPRVLAMIQFAERRPESLFGDWTAEDWYTSRARLMLRDGRVDRAAATARGARQAGLSDLAQRLDVEIEAEARHRQAMEEVERARAHFAAARPEDARRALERALEIDAECGIAWVMLADLDRRSGNVAAAAAALARASTSPDSMTRAESALMTGDLELGRHRPLAAAERYHEVQRWDPRDVRGYLLEARARREGGDLSGAREALRRGLGALPRNAELTRYQAELGTGP